MFQRTVYLLSLNIVSEKTIYHKTRGTTVYMFSLTERYQRNINHLNILMKALISYYAISGFADNTNMRALTNMQLSYYHIHILPTLGQHQNYRPFPLTQLEVTSHVFQHCIKKCFEMDKRLLMCIRKFIFQGQTCVYR